MNHPVIRTMPTHPPVSSSEKVDKQDACGNCLRPRPQCICRAVAPLQCATRVLVLQHPQERHKLLNSAMLLHLALPNSVVRVGLSWRSFSHALGGDDAPHEWGVLQLKGVREPTRTIEIFSPKNLLLPRKSRFKGIIVIDGSWKQAKTIWWRNPWLLKLNRITLNPDHPSLRAQAKQQGLATIEAVALAFDCLGENAAVGESLRKQFEELIIRPNSANHG